MDPLAISDGKRLGWTLALAASLMTTLAVITGCGGGSSSASGGTTATTSGSERASYPVASNETGRQTLRRARRYMAGKPAFKSAMEKGIRTCGSDDIDTLAKRYGGPAEPLSLGSSYSKTFSGPERVQAAALGCYLGAQIRLEGEQRRGETE